MMLCVCVPVTSPTPPHRCNRSTLILLANGEMALQARNRVRMSTGHRSMVPLNAHLACTAAEALQASQPSLFAHRTQLSRVRCSSMFVATWNVRSLLESEGSVEAAHQTSEV